MFTPDQYQLLGFGQGKKWENFGGVIVERETPSVSASIPRSPLLPENHRANLIFRLNHQVSQKGTWLLEQSPKKVPGLDPDGFRNEVLHDWKIRHRNKTFLLKQTPSGQVGLFPEQAVNWEWIESIPESLEGLKGINLFGYTGGTTISLASRGVEMVHIDAADSVVKWARQNAALSGLEKASIRWIAEDALRFVGREIKRGSKYDILVLDPPTFGRGPKGEQWKIDEQLVLLLEMLADLSRDRLKMLVLSCHTPGFEAPELLQLVKSIFKLPKGALEGIPMDLKASDQRLHQRLLNAGHCVRFLRLENES